jgi:hypothetical protein
MATKSRKTTTTQKAAVQILPASTLAALTKAQICFAAQISPRKFQQLRAAGQFPEPDGYNGDRPRWLVTTFNEWLLKYYSKGD